jgi:methylenetetrahydrofolate dehydrogenase (NADP+)/methenyltetrahydrofolate cyclohydrolase
MTAQIINGTQLSQSLKTSIKQTISQHREKGDRTPKLAVIVIGDDPASHIYVSKKKQTCADVGIESLSYTLPSQATQSEMIQLIATLNHDKTVDGILLQLPLPSNLNTDMILNSISPAKDIDGLSVYQQGLLACGQPQMIPCTPKGILKMLESTGVPLQGKIAAIIGRSRLVGAPLTRLLCLKNMTTIQLHSKSLNIEALTQLADVVVAASGVPELIQGSWIKKGAIVIDVGIHRRATGSLVGDVQFSSCSLQAGWISPVPGGVGPMTIACLLENTLKAYLLNLI